MKFGVTVLGVSLWCFCSVCAYLEFKSINGGTFDPKYLLNLLNFACEEIHTSSVSVILEESDTFGNVSSLLKSLQENEMSVRIWGGPRPEEKVSLFLQTQSIESLRASLESGFWDPSFYYVIPFFGEENPVDILTFLWDRFHIYNAYLITPDVPPTYYTYDPVTRRVTDIAQQEHASFRKSLSNWHGGMFYAVGFNRRPSLVMRHNGDMKGYDGELLKILCERMNVSLIMQPTLDNKRFIF
jgi:hypothetical protein